MVVIVIFPFHIGGPLNQNNGFILHSNDYKNKSTMKVSNNVCLTVSTDILIDIAQGKGPDFFISLGYSGWGPGQLEDEIKNNSWINLRNKDLLFDKDTEDKWNNAIKRTGIDFSKFSNFLKCMTLITYCISSKLFSSKSNSSLLIIDDILGGNIALSLITPFTVSINLL